MQRVDSTNGFEKTCACLAASVASRTCIKDKHASYNQRASLLLKIREILKRYLPFGFKCFSGCYSFGFELFSLLSFGFFPVYCLY